MRVTKADRKKNAREWWNNEYNNKKLAFYIERKESSNPNICKTQFIARTHGFGFDCANEVIAESNFGVSGCFNELFSSIAGKNVSIEYYSENFASSLNKELKCKITYNDGLIVMIEKRKTTENSKEK